MVKLVALYRRPAELEAFDKAFSETHVPLVKKIPGLVRLDVMRVTGAPRGEPEYYQISELSFESKATMDKAMASPENLEAGKNLMSFARGLVTFLFVDEVTI